MIKEMKGDVLEQKGIIAHQTNCVGVMGAGVAAQIRRRLTVEQYNSYRFLCRDNGEKLLGSVQYVFIGSGQIIANVFGENIPTGNGVDTDYEALKKGLQKVHDFAKDRCLPVSIPGRMGCGLAGGDWNYVYNEIIVPIFEDSEVLLNIVYFEK